MLFVRGILFGKNVFSPLNNGQKCVVTSREAFFGAFLRGALF